MVPRGGAVRRRGIISNPGFVGTLLRQSPVCGGRERWTAHPGGRNEEQLPGNDRADLHSNALQRRRGGTGFMGENVEVLDLSRGASPRRVRLHFEGGYGHLVPRQQQL